MRDSIKIRGQGIRTMKTGNEEAEKRTRKKLGI